MKLPHKTLLGVILLAAALPLRADDTVTIPKSRLEELQRKEADLEALKNQLLKAKTDLDQTKGENQQLKKQHEVDAVKIAQPSAPAHESAPLASLPPLNKVDPIDAMDLANYYQQDPAAADQRFRKQSFPVQGQIIAFEKPLFTNPYKILLKTPDRDVPVVCEIQPPEKYNSVFIANHGSQMVGSLTREYPDVLARLGDLVVVRGECKGLRDGRVVMAACELKSAQPSR
jgi:hypothetical protein